MKSVSEVQEVVKTRPMRGPVRLGQFLADRPANPQQWGNWRAEGNTLRFCGAHSYEIDLDRAKTAEDVLDWIWHVSERFSAEEMADLLEAFRCLRGNLVYGARA